MSREPRRRQWLIDCIRGGGTVAAAMLLGPAASEWLATFLSRSRERGVVAGQGNGGVTGVLNGRGGSARAVVAAEQAGRTAIDLELATEAGAPPSIAQQWLQALKDAPVESLRIRSQRGDERPETSDAVGGRIKVFGLVTASGTLVVPGAKFALAEHRRFRAWLEKIRAGERPAGPAGSPSSRMDADGKPIPFGLTVEQIVKVYQALEPAVPFETKGRRPAEVARSIRELVALETPAAPGVREAFAQDETVLDDLRGVSAGTALAAVCRPLGVAITPRFEDNTLKLGLVPARGLPADSVWPVGWPSDKALGELAPSLLKFLDVEIADTPFADVIEALRPRIKLPVLYDHNGLARQELDPATAVVRIGKGRTFYSKVLDRAAIQAKLRWELRIDEAGRPLIWIAPRIG